jgi:hypothetical protein
MTFSVFYLLILILPVLLILFPLLSPDVWLIILLYYP